ncbi:cytoplasmic 60S subunit biogenesis factor ZNF622 [Labrus mixtus]|uniref:cytoplasmic 60S subunit biogenesis factor ZNF622 n=1 Tax=Labrus mixtus TaxID=508554 RepID=UPI0029C01AD0|nr:cytoplasmic 60S subunit biogenesis factor ZNF622 [Labrus mixtus]XP_060899594.1 cytoplasmic 60S subunit biogenesis factor ZNF622 [Labrus mixtus]
MSSYTCISCRVAFADGEVQRAHYKTDWHRYNLKRKVADMPPVTAENFQERVLAQRLATEQQLSDAAATEGCGVCNKKFSSANAYQNHLQSHKHQQAEKQALLAAQRRVEKMNEKNLEKGLGDEKVDRDARNEALQQALKEQQRSSAAQTSQGVARQRTEKQEKPPRLMWLEEQAKRREREDGATPGEDDWEDVDDNDDEMVEEEEEEDEEEEEEAMDQEAAGSDPQPAALPGSIPVTECLFCSHHSRTLMKNVSHMTKVHGFFIPDVEFVIDLKGLIRYLGEKVGAGNVCLWCNEKGRSFYSAEAVQSHMTDKSHCKLFTEGDAALEFADYYDFRSSYPDRKEGEDADMGGDELPDDKTFEYDDETLELTLPSGAKIGHRSLMRYYKQRFGAQRAVALSHNRNAVGRVLRQYRALGWGGDGGYGSLYQKQRDMQYVQMMKSKWMLKMGMSHNSTKQTHFRCQVMF